MEQEEVFGKKGGVVRVMESRRRRSRRGDVVLVLMLVQEWKQE